MMSSYDSDNIFASILRNEVPCKRVYEDEYALAFWDNAPLAETHVLVVPKGEWLELCHFLEGAEREQVLGFWAAVGRTVDVLGLREKGFRLISNCGVAGGQEVPHFHVHILSGSSLPSMKGLSS